MKLSDLGVRQRLSIGFGVLLVLLALELTYTLVWFRRLDHLRDALSDDVGPRAEAASRLERAILSEYERELRRAAGGPAADASVPHG